MDPEIPDYRRQTAAGSAPHRDKDTWRPLRFLNIYRAVLSGLFVTLVALGTAPRSLGQTDARLFIWVAVLYLGFAIASSLSIRLRWPEFHTQVFIQVLTDILATSLLMQASGGVSSGLGMLLVVAVAGGSILTAGRTAILFAAIASLAILMQEIYASVFHMYAGTHYTQSGLLGATCFATAILAHVLAVRIRESEALATQRGLDLANMEKLNETIIQRMRSGILVVDGDGYIRLANESARKMLGVDGSITGRKLGGLASELHRMWQNWRHTGEQGARVFRPQGSGSNMIASFADLARQGSEGALIFLEDSGVVNQQAQQLKLASLGRLTASIAHEIRNPLGAISHAGQLLAESARLTGEDHQMTSIIRKHTERVNGIIENIMQLSRRRPPDPRQIELGSWLHGFVDELLHEQDLLPEDVRLLETREAREVTVDPSQLHQVLSNLCGNGLRHAKDTPRLVLCVGCNDMEERVYLDVCDSGGGVDDSHAEHLFEPFFTTASEGTGLGLYIARELCEVNQATLRHQGMQEMGHCFRITFAHPGRKQVSLS